MIERTVGLQPKPHDYYTGHNDHILEALPSEASRILDVGCAAGALGERIKRARPNAVVHGIDRATDALAEARGRLDRVFELDLDAPLPAIEEYDCIIFGDVLEHLEDPWRVIREFTPRVPIGGHVIASIPNIRYYKVLRDLVWRGRFEYQERGILDSTHLRFFTLHEMRHLFEQAGLRVLSTRPRICGGNDLIRFLDRVSGGRFEELRAMQYTLVGVREATP